MSPGLLPISCLGVVDDGDKPVSILPEVEDHTAIFAIVGHLDESDRRRLVSEFRFYGGGDTQHSFIFEWTSHNLYANW